MKLFSFLADPLADLDSASAALLVTAAADVSLVVDGAGVIVDLAFGSEDLLGEVDGRWHDKPWAETVAADSRAKVEAVLEAIRDGGAPGTLQVTHTLDGWAEIPVRYRVAPLGDDGRMVALGHDLRPIAVLQQQLMNAQQSLERDYWQLRQMETRYRLLFQMTADAVLVVDAASGKVLEANPAAGRRLAGSARTLIGRPFPAGMDAESTAALEAMLAEARVVGRAATDRVRLAEGGEAVDASVSLIRQDEAPRFLVRLSAPRADAAGGEGGVALETVLRQAPDAVLVTDGEARVLSANAAFLDLAQLASPEQAKGAFLERWLGRSGVDMSVMLANLRQHGAVRLFPTTLRGELGAATAVEISATAFASGEQPRFVFFVRNVERRISADAPMREQLPRSVEQVTERVGRVPLKELVGESTDLIERLCIEEALKMTGGNRASAAELLGLSRQSLYAKLRRYGLGGPAEPGED